MCPKREVKRVQVNFTFDNLEGHDDVSLEEPVFKWKVVVLAKPLSILEALHRNEISISPFESY